LKNPKSLEAVTRIFFNQRRKKIKKPINQIFENNSKIIEKLNLNMDLRPQNLDIKTFCKIASEYNSLLLD
jgi:16S rRNA (adenine1518-N6/adenine1519-N6)-dimethyltransferase